MSETDDTDVLLLIPPNFFLVPSSASEESLLESSRTVVHKPVSCTARVIGQLVDQVHSLESRLENLELDTSNAFSTLGSSRSRKNESCNDRSLDRKCFTFPRRRRRKLRRFSNKDISLTSFESSLNKFRREPVSAEHINDSPSMDSDISSIVSTPSKKNDKLLLNEIDDFLTKVESYESPESKFKKVNPDNVIKATSDYITQKLDSQSANEIQLPSGRKVSSNVLDKYIYLVKNRQEQESKASASNFANESDSSYNSIHKPGKSPSRRKLNFPEQEVQPTSTPKRNVETNPNYSDIFKPSCNKVFDRATKVLEQYRSQCNSRNTASDAGTSKQDEFKMPQMKPFTPNHKGFKLDSIDTELLSLSELWGEKEGDKLESLKLEEERLKREHCEALIQQLQKKLLDQQEKLAVAMKVDRSKDAAIAKLREAWLKLTSSLDKAEERHKAALEKMVKEVENFKCVANEAQKKTSHFERELYKALDLAHDYQEKCKKITIEKTELQEGMDRVISQKEDTIKLKEKEIETFKENYDTVMRLNKQSTDCVKNLQDDLEKEKLEHQATIKKIEELNSKIESMCKEALLLKEEQDIHKNKINEERSRCTILERQLCDSQNQNSEVLQKCNSLESECHNLRRQLEMQKTELKSHYQQQLEEAVLGKLQQFQAQLERAQADLEASAAAREAHAADAYHKQIIRLQDQHRLEVEVLEEKQREEIKLYRLQLAQASEKIGLLESKVESWRRRRGQMAAQLHAVMQAQWHQALSILTRPHTARPLTDHTGTSFEKPDRDISFNLDALSDAEMQNYLKMLLTKPPNLDVNELSPEPLYTDEPTSDRPDKSRKDKVKRTLSTKPPWKS